MIDTHTREKLGVTFYDDEPPIIHNDETLDLEEYRSTIVSDDEVAE